MVTTNLISFNKWLFHYILCIFSYGFELQLGGAVEISPRVLVVLKPPLTIGEVGGRACKRQAAGMYRTTTTIIIIVTTTTYIFRCFERLRRTWLHILQKEFMH